MPTYINKFNFEYMTLSDYRLQRYQWAPLAEGVSNTKLHLIFDTRIINLRLLFLRDITNKLLKVFDLFTFSIIFL